MTEAVVREKDPRLVEAGRKGMRSRWGERRVVRLDQLDADTRRLVLALVAQAEARPADESERSA
jgi:hypothetical protein